MPIGSVKLIPGVNSEFTPTLNEAGYTYSNLGRFKAGLFQKYGGWTKFYNFPIGSVVRDLHAWQDLNAINRLGVGAESSLSVITAGVNNNITPQQTTTNETPDFSTTMSSATVTVVDNSITPSALNSVFFYTPVSVGGIILSGMYPIQSVTGANSYTITASEAAASSVSNGGAVPAFSTTNASASVTVTLANHGYSVGDSVTFLLSTTGGGVTISGTYTVRTVPGANTFTIIVSNTATSTASFDMNGGDVRALYYITIAPTSGGSGYGVGGYGLGGYSTGVAAPSGTGTPITATDWTLDNWGEILVACPEGGAIYTWQPGSGFRTASVIETGPTVNGGIFVAMPQQILVAWGSSFDGVYDPLLVRWSDVSDYTQWIAASSNQAGSYRIPTGSKIVGALQAPQQGLIWTDIDLWSMQYQGAPFVWSFTKVMTGCGLVGKAAAGVLGNNVYWMGPGNFYVLGSQGPVTLPCPVWDVVFQNLDTDNDYKVRCGVNSQFDEIAWFFPSITGGTGEVDSCVKYNATEKAWDYSIGTFGRTAWIDQSVLGSAIGASGATGIIYQHETTNDADGQAMNTVFETGYFMLAEGWFQVFVDLLWNDFKYGTYSGDQDAQIQITFNVVNYPGDTPVAKGPYTVQQATEFVNTRLRGRQASMRVESADLGSFWRIGNIRYRFAQDGRR